MEPMGCLTDDIVLAYVEGRLVQSAAPDVDRHLSECVACRGLVAETARLSLDASARDGTEHERADDYTQQPTIAIHDNNDRTVSLDVGAKVSRYLIIGVIGA